MLSEEGLDLSRDGRKDVKCRPYLLRKCRTNCKKVLKFEEYPDRPNLTGVRQKNKWSNWHGELHPHDDGMQVPGWREKSIWPRDRQVFFSSSSLCPKYYL
jgi:hypothetical protein